MSFLYSDLAFGSPYSICSAYAVPGRGDNGVIPTSEIQASSFEGTVARLEAQARRQKSPSLSTLPTCRTRNSPSRSHVEGSSSSSSSSSPPGTPQSSASREANTSAISSIGSQWSFIDLGTGQGSEDAVCTIETRTTVQKLNIFRSFQSQSPPSARPSLDVPTNGDDPFDRRSDSYLPNVSSRRPVANESSLFNFAVYETASKIIARSSTCSHRRTKSRGGPRQAQPSSCTPSPDLNLPPAHNTTYNIRSAVDTRSAITSSVKVSAMQIVTSASRLRPLILPQRVAIKEALSKAPRHEPPKSLLLPAELARREPPVGHPQPEMVLYALSRVALETVVPAQSQSPASIPTTPNAGCTIPLADAPDCCCPPQACCCTTATRLAYDTSLDSGNSANTSIDWEADLIEAYAL